MSSFFKVPQSFFVIGNTITFVNTVRIFKGQILYFYVVIIIDIVPVGNICLLL